MFLLNLKNLAHPLIQTAFWNFKLEFDSMSSSKKLNMLLALRGKTEKVASAFITHRAIAPIFLNIVSQCSIPLKS